MNTTPVITILHTPEHADIAAFMKAAEVKAPAEVHAFTDTHPTENPYNSQLGLAVKASNILVVEQNLLDEGTSAAILAFTSLAKDQLRRRHMYVVTDDYQLAENRLYLVTAKDKK